MRPKMDEISPTHRSHRRSYFWSPWRHLCHCQSPVSVCTCLCKMQEWPVLIAVKSSVLCQHHPFPAKKTSHKSFETSNGKKCLYAGLTCQPLSIPNVATQSSRHFHNTNFKGNKINLHKLTSLESSFQVNSTHQDHSQVFCKGTTMNNEIPNPQN